MTRTEKAVNCLITTDKVMDFLPFVSILNNTINLLAKIILGIISFTFSSTYQRICENKFISYLNNKKVCVCIFMTIPFFNVLFASAYHDPNRTAISRSQNQPKDSSTPLKDSPLDEQINHSS